MNLSNIQTFMAQQRIDGWLLYDFRGSNPVFAQLVPDRKMTTRRAFFFIPVKGEAVLLMHGIDRPQFGTPPCRAELYLTWREMIGWLANALAGRGRVAMEYAPGGILPAVSYADAGTVELVRSLGVEVVSSANLIQVFVAQWSPVAVEAHRVASKQVNDIKDAAFDLIRRRHAAKQSVSEIEVKQFILERFESAGLAAPDGPIVAVNGNSGDPHYEPTEQTYSPIKPGDWVLIDLWARKPGDEHIFSDVTWVGFAGREPTAKHREVFNVVKAARDSVVERVKSAWNAGERIQGWQLDDAARNVIIGAGYERYMRHRTGHSLSPGPKVHGMGFNLDNLETHDTREVMPGLGFTIEPGIYLPEFGVRLEINVFMDPQRGPTITSGVQTEIILLN